MSRVQSMSRPGCRERAVRPLLGLTATTLGALIVASVGFGASRTETFGVKAVLDARQEAPRQVVKVPIARGTFSGLLTVRGSTGRIAWRLTFTHLSGPALQANIQLGKLGKAGPIAVVLCAPCHSNVHSTARVAARVVRAIKNGAA